MKWEFTNRNNSLEEFIEMQEKRLEYKKQYELHAVKKNKLVNLSEIVKILDSGLPITVVGDYDVDGVISVAELDAIAQKKGWNMKYRLPKRFSEGYGLSAKIVDEINEGILITVDNGIAAHEAILKAKKKGLYVIVTDHHLTVKTNNGEDNLPEADIILNPHIHGTCDYEDYCGAGIVYKLAEYLFPDDEEFLDQLSIYAAIATIADCVPLLEDNRKITQRGLKNIHTAKKTTGLTALLTMTDIYFRPLLVERKNSVIERKSPDKCRNVFMKLKTGEYISGYYAQFDKFLNPNRKVVKDETIETWAYTPKELSPQSFIDEYVVSFKIAPMINAPGRLFDDGANLALDLITFNGPMSEAMTKALNIYSVNEERKVLVDEGFKQLQEMIVNNKLYNNYPLCIYKESLHEGIIGILAGKILEKYKTPAIVFTNCNGQLKGSARSNENLNIKELLDKHSNLIVKYGGHPEAAGLSIRIADFGEFDRALRGSVKRTENTETLKYELILNESDVVNAVKQLNVLKPYGIGNPKPKVLIRKYELVPDIYYGKMYRLCQEGRSVMFNSRNTSAIGFDLFSKYNEIIKNPIADENVLNIVGTIGENHFNGRVTPTIEIIDMKA